MMRYQERLDRREDDRDAAQRKWQRDESHFNKWTRIAELALITIAAGAASAAVIVSVL